MDDPHRANMPMKMMMVIRCGRCRRGGRASHEHPRHVDDPHRANMPMKMMMMMMMMMLIRCGRRRRGGRAGNEHSRHVHHTHKANIPLMRGLVGAAGAAEANARAMSTRGVWTTRTGPNMSMMRG